MQGRALLGSLFSFLTVTPPGLPSHLSYHPDLHPLRQPLSVVGTILHDLHAQPAANLQWSRADGPSSFSRSGSQALCQVERTVSAQGTVASFLFLQKAKHTPPWGFGIVKPEGASALCSPWRLLCSCPDFDLLRSRRAWVPLGLMRLWSEGLPL